jgi:opacity protein-like surface antigen
MNFMNGNLKSILIVALLVLAAGAHEVSSQVIKVDTITVNKTRTIRLVSVYSVPKFILQFSASYNSGALELSGHNGGFSRADFDGGRTFGARNGFGFALTGKLPLNKKGQFWVDAMGSFNRFQSNLIAKNTEEGKVYYNVFSGGLGAEYNFTPYHKVKYFVGLSTLFSVVQGKANLVDKTPTDTTNFDVKIKPSFRIGYTAFIGLEFEFQKNFGVNAGLRFTHVNLLLKKSTEPAVKTERELNDESLKPAVLYSGWKQFAYSSVFAGFSYYFGLKKTRYKLP